MVRRIAVLSLLALGLTAPLAPTGATTEPSEAPESALWVVPLEAGGSLDDAMALGVRVIDAFPDAVVLDEASAASAFAKAGYHPEGPFGYDPTRTILLLRSHLVEEGSPEAPEVPGGRTLWAAGADRIVEADGPLEVCTPEGCLAPKVLSTTPLRGPAPTPAAPALSRATTFEPFVDQLVAQVDSTAYFQWIRKLAGAEAVMVGGGPFQFTTRQTMQPQCRTAEQYAHEQFVAMGFPSVEYDSFTVGSATARNIVATLPGTETPDDVLIICGHLDSISGAPSISAPGANDNASGSAAVLAAAEIMAGQSFASTIKFILFTGEEQGLFGSVHYAQQALAQGENIVGVVNCDMVAYFTSFYSIEIEARAFAEPLMFVLRDACQQYTGLGTALVYAAWGSDHVPFLDRGFPAVLAIEKQWSSYPCYHNTCDTWDRNQAGFGADVTRATIATIAHLAGEPTGTGVVSGGATPGVRLSPASPNPFRGATRIAFSLAARGPVDLAVYDISGRRVRTLLREWRAAGEHAIRWDGTNAEGAAAAAGVYWLKLSTARSTSEESVVHLR